MDIGNVEPLDFAVSIELGLFVALPSKHVAQRSIVPSRIINLAVLTFLCLSVVQVEVAYVLDHQLILLGPSV